MASGRKSSLATGLSWQQVHLAIVSLGERVSREQLELLQGLLAQFVAENEDPRTSPHLRATAPDQLDPLVALLARADVARAANTRLLATKALKILARRQDVRLRCSQHALDVVVALLDATDKQQQPAEVAGEAANALSNLCYEPANCSGLLRAGGVARLLKLLEAGSAGIDALMNAAGALQTLSFQPDARAAVLKASGPATLLHRLASCCTDSCASVGDGSSSSSEGKLQQRLVGALHNLSGGADGIAAIRQQGGIPAIVQLLPSQHPGVAASAAGALQNMSREEQAREDIRAHPHAVPGLTALLAGADMQAAVCAAGTLANLVSGVEGVASKALTQVLAGALAGGAINYSLFGSSAGVPS